MVLGYTLLYNMRVPRLRMGNPYKATNIVVLSVHYVFLLMFFQGQASRAVKFETSGKLKSDTLPVHRLHSTKQVWATHCSPTFDLSQQMGLGIWNILKACLLMTNAGAILHETRLLPAIGMPHVGAQPPGTINEQSGVKMKIAGLLNAVRYLRVPLIFINIIAVFFELLLG